jgi:hypothetical protein
MWKRVIFYCLAAAATIPVVVWLAFGPGIGSPYAVFTWPADRLVWYLNPGAGSAPAPDVLRDTVVSAGVWFVAMTGLDILLTQLRGRNRVV